VRKLRLKKEPFYKERDEEERKEFDEKLAELPEGTPVTYVDQSGVQQEMKRTHGRARRGVKLYVETSGKRSKKDNIVAGYCNGKVLGRTTYAWNTDTEWFCMWFEFVLIPLLAASSVIILDNASFHCKTYLTTIAEAYGHRIIFLPKYSPDKNPIEHVWASMKTWLRNYSKNYDTIRKAISSYFAQNFTVS
jgi:transposase